MRGISSGARALTGGLFCLLFSLAAFAAPVSYHYDALGRLVSVTNTNGSLVSYSYDAAGNRASPSLLIHPLVANNISVAYGHGAPSQKSGMTRIDVRNYNDGPDRDMLVVIGVGRPSGCTMIGNGPMIIVTASASPRVTCTVPYTISDGHGNSAGAYVTVHP